MKKKKISEYRKDFDRMQKEIARAVLHVEKLSKKYAELVKK